MDGSDDIKTMLSFYHNIVVPRWYKIALGYELPNEVIDWIENNITGQYYYDIEYNRSFIWFENETDYIFYKLTWLRLI